MSKRILIFIGLKIAELATVVFVPYGIGLLLDYWESGQLTDMEVWRAWGLGLLSLMVIYVFIHIGILVVLGVIEIIKANWKWAKKLTGKKGE